MAGTYVLGETKVRPGAYSIFRRKGQDSRVAL